MWIAFAFGSALFAGLTAILAKCGIKNTDSNVATAIRTIIVLIFSWIMVFVVGAQKGLADISGKTLLFLIFSGLSTGASWPVSYTHLIREEAGACTIKVCQDILTEQALQMESKKTSYFEFLYEQSRFIKKKWWVLQGGVLLYLWLWLSNNANDMKETMRLMGIFATMFVILIVPEVWKNRRNGAVEVEQASYYTCLLYTSHLRANSS